MTHEAHFTCIVLPRVFYSHDESIVPKHNEPPFSDVTTWQEHIMRPGMVFFFCHVMMMICFSFCFFLPPGQLQRPTPNSASWRKLCSKPHQEASVPAQGACFIDLWYTEASFPPETAYYFHQISNGFTCCMLCCETPVSVNTLMV